MVHTAETLLPWKEYCHDLNHSEMVHISRAKMVCKMYTLVYMYLLDGCSNEFKHDHLVNKNPTFLNTIKEVNFIFFLCLLNSFHYKKNFQNKKFHFYYCNYCSGCLNGMTEENIQAHFNDCSQHSSKLICRECGMVSEISCDTCTFFIFNSKLILFSKTKFLKKLFMLFLQIHKTPYLSFPSLSSKRDHEEMKQGDNEVMEGTDKKIKT